MVSKIENRKREFKIQNKIIGDSEFYFIGEIGLVGGNEWQGGNLSYHLKSRPRWDNHLYSKKTISLKIIEGCFLIIGDNETLSNALNGYFISIGETVFLDVVLENVGNDSSSNINISLSNESNFIGIVARER